MTESAMQRQTGHEIVVQIKKGYEIEILLAESSTNDFEVEHNFIGKTKFGLLL